MKDAAIEILIYKPDPDHPLPENQRGVVINPHLKQRFKQFVPIGVYLEGSDLKYYFFDQCDKSPKIYSSLDELKRDLPEELDNIFEKNPKLFIMGHAGGGEYGMGNCHGPSEQLYDDNFDNLLHGFKRALPAHHGEVFVTLEGCNTDNQLNAAANSQEKTFLERVSVKHPEITFGGTGPWNAQDVQTGFRSLSPASPITSMAGNIWKAGNSVIFHHGEYQVAVRKSLFASTQTAKELKVNTIEYARAILGKDGVDELIAKIALNRDILNIQDLKKIEGFPELRFEGEDVVKFVEQEIQILGKEKENYLTRVRDILGRADPIEQLTDRDVLELLLGLKEPSVFKGHEDLLESILANKALLNLATVSCGKVLIGGPSNDSVIDLLLKHGADINSADKKGMTALHYAVQNFYNYRKEPLHLIKKLLECGASLEVRNEKGQTPIETAQEHSKDGRVTASDKLLASLKSSNSPPTLIELKQSVRQIFQMSQHKADELLSLPIAKREYSKCSEGTLYIPEDVVEKLHGILQSATGSNELLSAFESELSVVISALEKGIGTGEAIDGEEDEFIPKRFENAKLQLTAVIDALVGMKQEMDTSKDATVEDQLPKLKS
ncbi:ankyrin repeat domain-containing protein [Legionella pneumophila serogroup 1]|uniref:ankyrin repeat domain-containing protein n=1 Tax=Legionella pneumophila TaxID=446 RepID=UPI0007709113|nr:ankyrin repeat domain-containing protein [Legionella pneumophila]HAT8862533.1 ankyrin repeat domain-containing protein [Legionella pneumophila subsp. pneumophila]MDI9825875.1 ankyrin repeat domain-containing protein [Legionella pneumophila]MDW8897003.1 ankyrin repeat domain-containing protein [Legionella pneumophila]CZH48986.1 Ankyrin repeats (3 copies) [Legionella pneumophila]CZI54486.1 Ankyrin repeats (3 copies) [Legionella pneumophila]